MESLSQSALMTRYLHNTRKTESWIISEVALEQVDKEAMIGAHLNVHDYFGPQPFLVFSIPKPLRYGKIFKDVYLLTPDHIPDHQSFFLANGIFLRRCLLTSVEDGSGVVEKLHTFDGIELLMKTKDSRTRLESILSNTKAQLIGLHGQSRTHLSRGLQ